MARRPDPRLPRPRPTTLADGDRAGRGHRRPRVRRRAATSRTWPGPSSRSTPRTRCCAWRGRPRPTRWPVQADLEALPFRRGALGAAWARASYLHVRTERLPARARRPPPRARRRCARDARRSCAGETSGPWPDDDFPGRWFAAWSADRLGDVLVGAGFDVARRSTSRATGSTARADPGAHAARHGRTRGCALLVCGLNPSVYSADAGVGFARPGNRFWPAAIAAGLVTVDRDAARALRARGIGMTDLVKRATPRRRRADAATSTAPGSPASSGWCEWLQPGAVCFVGLAGWRAAVDRNARRGGAARRHRWSARLRDAEHQRSQRARHHRASSPTTSARPPCRLADS